MILTCPHCAGRCRIKDDTSVTPGAMGRCPRCGATFDLAAALSPESVDVGRQPSPRVLVVDDSAFFREMICDLLAPLNGSCVAVATTAEAWARLGSEGIELVITDLNLTDGNGVEFVRQLRQHPRAKHLPILAVSGVYRQDEDQRAVLDAGADAFQSKSFRPEDFLQTVRQLLQKRRSP